MHCCKRFLLVGVVAITICAALMYSNGFGFIDSYSDDSIQPKSAEFSSLSQDIYSFNENNFKKTYNQRYPPKYFPGSEKIEPVDNTVNEDILETLEQHLSESFEIESGKEKTDDDKPVKTQEAKTIFSVKDDTIQVHVKPKETLDTSKDVKPAENPKTPTKEKEDPEIKGEEIPSTKEQEKHEDAHKAKIPHITKPRPHLKPDLKKVALFSRFNVPVKTLFDTLEGEDTTFLKHWLVENKNYDIKIGHWKKDNAGADMRESDYKLEVSTAFVSGTTTIHVEDKVDKSSEEYVRYVIDSTSQTRGIQYADKFYTSARYLLRAISDNESELRVSIEVNYIDNSLWSIVKSAIESNVFKEVDVSLKSLGSNLNRQFSRKRR